MLCFHSWSLGVAPLAVATGAGTEMRQSLGTAVLFGMLKVTGFGLLFTPVFYTFIRQWAQVKYHWFSTTTES
jgi:multidrug efflux pump subunit AcrB